MFPAEQLQQGALRLGINLTDKQLEAFSIYHQLLLEWNQRINLISKADEARIVTHHFLDSLTPLPHFSWSEETSLLDLGSGAGFPGVPIKIVQPQISLTLLDSRRKRILFLKKLVSSLGLESVSVICERAEKLCWEEGYRERFDLVTLRSVAPLLQSVSLALPFLKKRGKLILFKGPEEDLRQLNLNDSVSIDQIPVRFPKRRILVIVERL